MKSSSTPLSCRAAPSTLPRRHPNAGVKTVHGCRSRLSDPRLEDLGHRPAYRLSSVVDASVVQHRLRRLSAATPVPVVELVDPLAVRA
jgi:hypothetical protein